MRHMSYYTVEDMIYFVITTASGESYAYVSGSDYKARLYQIAHNCDVQTIERLD